ncbi:HSF-type DNA-binding-domain-containing protein [Cokeromyces recurvatus]|uniref:HSF-type DNA-binding-domain-containing protein n=1 Tax=Cokeromyces recurvatus TaxID=90255 RepID=UPI00221FD570|nr:HSF-type DNA-binding-domain-containing protein [Cokeromyces recurvatus]KAI7901154.1 HSF-type DNA-binding-domain-containing protein [Cokeromyces recurvatus]
MKKKKIEDERHLSPPTHQQVNSMEKKGRRQQNKHGFVERFFRVAPTRNAAFITKLFAMVDDESTQNLIAWTGSGDQFTVFNNVDFSRKVLPCYFKHCNWSSFVRQLNMYDFHKTKDANSDMNTSGSHPQRWDFKHPWFYKTGFDKLHKIRRKPPRNRLIPQIRYSNVMDVVPSESSEYDIDSSASPKLMDSAIQETIHQLQISTESLEEKLDHTIKEVKDLKAVVENQRKLLNSLITTIEYIKPNQEEESVIYNTHDQVRKPRKIHELLGSTTTESATLTGVHQHHDHHYNGDQSSRDRKNVVIDRIF